MPTPNPETKLGRNRTGVQMAPQEIKKMLSGMDTELAEPSSKGDASAIADVRARYIEQAEPIGSVPPPATAKGALKAGAKMLTGAKPQVLLDKLAERLAFERSGTRLYDALIAKCKADGGTIVQPDRLMHFREEEAQHFKMVNDCIEKLGGDPTAQTPGANLAGIEGMGLMQVVTEPKTSLAQSLHSVLVAELTDNAAWDELVVLAEKLGQDEMVKQFREAQQTEREHLEQVKTWHQELTLSQANA